MIENKEFFNKYFKHLWPYRSQTFIGALLLAHHRGAKYFVETGTTRKDDFYGDGKSTYIFGDFCHTFTAGEGKVWTCDIEPDHINSCKEITKDFEKYIEYVTDDSLNFLKDFDHKIDFLYLDSFDSGEGRHEAASEHNLKELKLCLPKLHDQTIIMIDDYHVGKNTGKGMYSVPYLLENGWKLLNNDGYQGVLIKNE